MALDNLINFIFKIKNTLIFLFMVFLSYMLISNNILGYWIFLLDVPDFYYSLKELRGLYASKMGN
jgi:hypothetical protein